MKKLFTVITLAFAMTTLAQTAPEASLKSLMKDMSTKLKAIAAQSTDAAKNASSEQLALDLVKTIEAAKAVMPQSANDKNSQDQYVNMMNDVSLDTQALATAFHNNDNAKATELLAKLSQQKKDGHAKFK